MSRGRWRSPNDLSPLAAGVPGMKADNMKRVEAPERRHGATLDVRWGSRGPEHVVHLMVAAKREPES